MERKRAMLEKCTLKRHNLCLEDILIDGDSMLLEIQFVKYFKKFLKGCQGQFCYTYDHI